MKEGYKLQINCQGCETPILFSIIDQKDFACKKCGKKYAFHDETLLRHLQQFEALCRQIQASKEILGGTSIAIDVGQHHVKVPFNILLTRLNSVIDLEIGDKTVSIGFRVDSLNECTYTNSDQS